MRPLVRLLLLAAALPAFAAPASKNRAVIQFRTPAPGLPFILLDARVGGADLPLLLDTGDALPFELVLSPEAAARAGASPEPGPVFVSRAAIGGVPVSVKPARARPLEIGPVHLDAVSTGVSPAVDLASAALAVPVAGILGYDFLRGRLVAIDYACGRLDLAAEPPRGRPTAQFTITPRRPVALVPVTVNGRGPFRLALDTGARTTILGRAAADAAGLSGRGRFGLLGAGGGESATLLGPARLRVGAAPPVTTTLLASDALDRISDEAGARVDGILGANLFASGTLTIDYPGGRLWFSPSPKRCPS
jgi:predicted aspartyl protease